MILNFINQVTLRRFKILIVLFLLSTHCLSASSIIMPENKFLKDIQLVPQKLKLERDSIRFTVKGSIPIESVLTPNNPRLILSFKSDQSHYDLGEINLKKNVSSYSYERSFALRYEPWMSSATLELSFFQGKKENRAPFEKKVLAKGVVAPQLMVKLGAVYPDEPIPEVGLYIPSGIERGITQKAEFEVTFDLGSSAFKSNAANQGMLHKIDSFLEENPHIMEIRITGLQSPESGDGKNSALGMNRAESAKKNLVSRIKSLSDSQIKLDSRKNDWFDLRLLLVDYKGISTDRKEEFYTILTNQETYMEQIERMKRVPGFSQVVKDLYPKLRVAKIEISAKPRNGLDMLQSIKLKESLNNTKGINSLTFPEWVLAAEVSQSLEEKAVIYSKMTEFFRSALPYNNMAVVRMRQAQRTLDQQSKEILWEETLRLLNQAYRIEPNPYTLHNQGQVLALEGKYWDSYLKLSEAASLTQNSDFLQKNEALRGALDILRGDYKLATLRFAFKFSDPKDYFNKGLAYYMMDDFVNASTAFEESVVHGRVFGYGYYGLAMVAAVSGQREVAIIHLKKAIEANRQLANQAFQDPLFEELRNSQEFFSGMSQN
jgi:outer membrane protein OmpA-like peptidoglycan-associated protein